MPSHRLILDRKRSTAAAGDAGGRNEPWLLEWDEKMLSLRRPDGEVAFEFPTLLAHWILAEHELYAEGIIRFKTPAGPLTFKRDAAAARDLRELVEAGLRADEEYRQTQRRIARRTIPIGLAMFIVFGGLFALYCWWASRAPDPPRGHWIYYVGPLIHLALIVLLGLAIAGPYAAWYAWRQLRRIDRAERLAVTDAARERPAA
jgi:hypothetical protein